MKAEANKLSKESREHVLAAVFRLKRTNRDFNTFLEFATNCLDDKKKELIIAPESNFKQLQGEASMLSGLFDLLELAEKEGSK